MNELVKIEEQVIGQDSVNAVDARELHNFLEVDSEFRNWISRRVEYLQLVENRDFIIAVKNDRNSKGRSSKEYTITIDAAKHIAMMERNEKGFQIREYFIQIEKEARMQRSTVLEDPMVKLAMKHAIIQQEQQRQLQMIIQQQGEIKRIKDDIEHEETYYKARAFAKMKGLRLTDKQLQSLGRKASIMSREHGYEIQKAKCASFGIVNRYHIKVLEMAIGE